MAEIQQKDGSQESTKNDEQVEHSYNPLISKKDGADFFEMYKKYNETLRTWFVAFGLGGLYLLLVNGEVLKALKAEKISYLVEWCFLIGIISQIVVAFLNKFLNWIVYYSTIKENYHKKRIYKIADKFSELIWFDLIFDIVTVGCFLFVFIKMITSLG